MRKKNPPKQNVWLIQDLYHFQCYVTESIVNTLGFLNGFTSSWETGNPHLSSQRNYLVRKGLTGENKWGETHLTFKCCPIVKKNLINQSVRKLPPFSQRNKIKSWKGEDTITAFTEVTENQVSGRKKGGEDGNIPLLNWVNVFSTVFKYNHRGNKISLYIYMSLW